MVRVFTLLIAAALLSFSVVAQQSEDRPIIHDLSAALTDVMIVDGFSPPQASRTYMYSHVAYYEVIRQSDSSYKSLAGQLNGLKPLDPAGKNVDLEMAALFAFREVGMSMVYRQDELKNKIAGLIMDRMASHDKEDSATKRYGMAVAEHIKRWMASDNYSKLKSMPRYELKNQPYSWEPTPPVYHDALEPNWDKLRTAFMKSADAFAPISPVEFDTVPGSAFYKQAQEVYEVVNKVTDEQRLIAKFWDCNPLQTQTEGHFMFKLKQMTPGGHWMAITGISCSDKGLSNLESSSIYTNVAIGLFDGFIAAWQAKYQYHLIRPVTYINRYIDKNWLPILETPPFPEYTSAHSVISRCAAEILNSRIGSEFSFTDTVETRWGYPIREFNSLIEAGIEVSDSRVYGGIHYRMGVEQGMDQGERLGKAILNGVKFKD